MDCRVIYFVISVFHSLHSTPANKRVMEENLGFDSLDVVLYLAGAMNEDYDDEDFDESEIPDLIPLRFFPRDHVDVTFHFKKSSGYERIFYGVLWGMFDRYYELPVSEVKELAQYHGVVVDRIENTPTLHGVRGSRHVYFTRIRPNVDETFEEDYAEDEIFEDDYVEDEVFQEIHVEDGTPENSK